VASRDLPEPKGPESRGYTPIPSIGTKPTDDTNPAGGDTYEGVRPGPVAAGGIKAH